MYTILHLYCSKELIKSTERVVAALGGDLQIKSCTSISAAKKILETDDIDCIIAHINKSNEKTMLLLEKWQQNINYIRNAIVLLTDDEQIVLTALNHIHFCEICFKGDIERNTEIVAFFLTHHYSLYQELQYYVKSLPSQEIVFLKTTDGCKTCNLSDILYIEAYMHKCIVQTICKSYMVSKPLSKFLIDPIYKEFKQSHRSFLVNPENIKKINKEAWPWGIQFYFCDKLAYVSRSFQQEFKDYS